MAPAGTGKAGPPWRTFALLTALAAVAATAWLVANAYLKARHEPDLRAMLIPNSGLPRTDAAWQAQADSLAARYPRDPRLRLYRGVTMLEAQDSAGAERELRAGLADAETLKELLPPQVETLLRTNLAIALDDIGKRAEARAAADPVCRLDTPENRPTRTRLKRIGVCD
jgi:hypothetical protein